MPTYVSTKIPRLRAMTHYSMQFENRTFSAKFSLANVLTPASPAATSRIARQRTRQRLPIANMPRQCLTRTMKAALFDRGSNGLEVGRFRIVHHSRRAGNRVDRYAAHARDPLQLPFYAVCVEGREHAPDFECAGGHGPTFPRRLNTAVSQKGRLGATSEGRQAASTATATFSWTTKRALGHLHPITRVFHGRFQLIR